VLVAVAVLVVVAVANDSCQESSHSAGLFMCVALIRFLQVLQRELIVLAAL